MKKGDESVKRNEKKKEKGKRIKNREKKKFQRHYY